MVAIKQDEASIKMSLASGYPVIFGLNVYESFESDVVANTGIVPMPNISCEKSLGGHAVLIVGYTGTGYFIVRNSWGVNWGMGYSMTKDNKTTYNYDSYGGKMRGYFMIPVAYVINPNLATSDSFYSTQFVVDPTIAKGGSITRTSTAPTYDPKSTSENPPVPDKTIYAPVI